MPRALPARLIIACTCCTLLSGVLPGCVIVTGGEWSGMSENPTVHATRTQSVAHVAGSPLEVKTENGDLSVIAAPGSDIVITSRLKGRSEERLDHTEVLAQRDSSGALKISVVWPDGKRQPSEGCSFEVRIPDGQGVKLDTGNGDIDVRGLAGIAELSTGNGDIDVQSHAGPLTVSSGNGEIKLLRVPSAKVHSGNGDIEVHLTADATGPVTADTGNGAIKLTIGRGFTGSLRGSTGNGTVHQQVGRGVTIGTPTKSRGEWSFGEGQASTLESGNGSITISQAK